MEEARGYGSFAVSGLGEVEEIEEIVLKQAIGEHARLQVKLDHNNGFRNIYRFIGNKLKAVTAVISTFNRF